MCEKMEWYVILDYLLLLNNCFVFCKVNVWEIWDKFVESLIIRYFYIFREEVIFFYVV